TGTFGLSGPGAHVTARPGPRPGQEAAGRGRGTGHRRAARTRAGVLSGDRDHGFSTGHRPPGRSGSTALPGTPLVHPAARGRMNRSSRRVTCRILASWERTPVSVTDPPRLRARPSAATKAASPRASQNVRPDTSTTMSGPRSSMRPASSMAKSAADAMSSSPATATRVAPVTSREIAVIRAGAHSRVALTLMTIPPSRWLQAPTPRAGTPGTNVPTPHGPPAVRGRLGSLPPGRMVGVGEDEVVLLLLREVQPEDGVQLLDGPAQVPRRFRGGGLGPQLREQRADAPRQPGDLGVAAAHRAGGVGPAERAGHRRVQQPLVLALVLRQVREELRQRVHRRLPPLGAIGAGAVAGAVAGDDGGQLREPFDPRPQRPVLLVQPPDELRIVP